LENIERSKQEIMAFLKELGWIENSIHREAQPESVHSTQD